MKLVANDMGIFEECPLTHTKRNDRSTQARRIWIVGGNERENDMEIVELNLFGIFKTLRSAGLSAG